MTEVIVEQPLAEPGSANNIYLIIYMYMLHSQIMTT